MSDRLAWYILGVVTPFVGAFVVLAVVIACQERGLARRRRQRDDRMIEALIRDTRGVTH